MTCPALVPAARPGPAPRPLVFVVMDGVGVGAGDAGDAVAQAATPNLDRYARSHLSTRLRAHGRAVGMPSDADMGNSEVGHNTMGSGQIFEQGASLVGRALRAGSLWRGPSWQRCVAQGRRGALHFIGLLSDGNVHSHIDHLLAMVQRAADEGVNRIRVHVLLDGRDVSRTSALSYIDRLEALLAELNQVPGRSCHIASGGGRMRVTMDRYCADWGMVERGWRLHVEGRGAAASSARAAILAQRAGAPGLGDQDLEGFVVHAAGGPVGAIADGDAVVAFNFRGDRMLELCEAFEAEDFPHFARGRRPEVFFVGLTQYDGDLQRPRHFLVEPPQIHGCLSEMLSAAGVAQLAVSETQKFGHVTYFWNGNRQAPFDAALERRICVPSRPPPFDQHPAMRAPEVVAATLAALAESPAAFVRVNFANGDMVGHTGNLAATRRALESIDESLGQLERALLPQGGGLIITGDHGNAEEMFELAPGTREPRRDAAGAAVAKTSHTLNPVPLHLVLPEPLAAQLTLSAPPEAGLANLAASVAVLLGFQPPAHMLPPVVAWGAPGGR